MSTRSSRTPAGQLTFPIIYDKDYVSRVTAKELDSTSMLNALKELEELSLPQLDHEGYCFLHLRFGVVTDWCPCFADAMLEETDGY